MNAYDVKTLTKLGINPADLGCIMLDVEKIDVSTLLEADWAYVSTNPERKWINGLNAGDHITLLYGLLLAPEFIKEGTDEVLAGWDSGEIAIDFVDSFPSPYRDETYSCIVGRIKVTPELVDAHSRLSYLPHIDTFWQYKPHVTLAYVGVEHESDAINILGSELDGKPLKALGINYGDKGKV